jgi:Spherulation-specific family 4
MRRIGIQAVSAVLLLATTTLLAMPADDAPRPGDPHPTTMLVPAYFYPAGDRLPDWNRLAEAARSVPLEVILNPASGPGERQDANYVAVVDALHRSHARVLAYVDSDYGRRPIAAIEKDVRAYPKFYKIDGFFIDQMANTPEAVDHYRSIRRLIRREDSRYKVVGNPGTPHTLPEYLDAADTLVTFEGSARAFAAYDPHAAAPWTAGHPPGRFAAII